LSVLSDDRRSLPGERTRLWRSSAGRHRMVTD